MDDMPLLWRYIVKNYFKVFFLIIIVFIAILLVLRSEEIARFTSLGSSIQTIGLFSLYQIPYILPIAIPVSALISAFLLIQRMSNSSELTALRSMGISFFDITIPLYHAGLLLSLLNFTLTAEVTPYCRMLSKELIYNSTSVNPLILLQKDKLLKLKNSYVDINASNGGKKAKDLLFALHNPNEDRLTLITAKKLSLEKDELTCKKFSLISTMDSGNENSFDHLTVENDNKVILDRHIFSHLVQSHPWTLNHEYLSLKYLLIKLREKHFSSIGSKHRTQTEVIRRIFLSFAPLTFTIIGVSFGFYVGRIRRKKGILGAIILSSLTLTFFLIGKSFQLSPYKALLFFFLPHPICILISVKYQRKISQGIET